MTSESTKTEAVAPLLRSQILGYENQLNIVERPSVGLLAATPKICTLINNVLGHSLSSFTHRQAGKVYVQCGRLTPSKLMLEVTADRAWRPRNVEHANWAVRKFEEDARRFEGEFATGDVRNGPGRPALDAFFRLIVPIPA